MALAVLKGEWLEVAIGLTIQEAKLYVDSISRVLPTDAIQFENIDMCDDANITSYHYNGQGGDRNAPCEYCTHYLLRFWVIQMCSNLYFLAVIYSIDFKTASAVKNC